MKISELIEYLEKIKETHGDLPVKTWEYDDCILEYYLGEAEYPKYYNYDEEECVIIGE